MLLENLASYGSSCITRVRVLIGGGRLKSTRVKMSLHKYFRPVTSPLPLDPDRASYSYSASLD